MTGKKKIVNYFIFSLFIIVVVSFFVWATVEQTNKQLSALAKIQRPGNFALAIPLTHCENQIAQVILTWTKANNALNYQVQRKISSQKTWQNYQNLLGSSQTNFTDNLTNFMEPINYRIRATNGSTSTYSNQVTAYPLNCSGSTPPPDRATSTVKWGAYVGWRLGDIADFETRVGKAVNHQALFVHWGNENEFPATLAQPLKNAGKTLIIFWEAMDYNIDSVDQPNFSYDRILAGDWDNYIKSFAAAAKTYGGPVILIPFEEMNGDWYPWAGTVNGNSPAKHIAAYRYLRGFFKDITNVKFGWSVNQESVPDTANNNIASYYPGNDYVDYVGVNGFNFGQPWQSFNDVFGKTLERLKAYQKPIFIFSFACSDGPKKAAWITDALTVQLLKYPQIKGWVWFNEKKERDWRVWSDQNSLKAFQAALP